ncbi:hypothetical protein H257_18827 [Aphanomyces astaci]|uniref:subtilisin n=1 Tax=Aphanomyces astaci TaxID=112090 RepID=W4F9X7_APHAT|nr:hypothetical protein H257_18827 [Aphanomyces astaci]ETV64262.1 hypothetical protein H257_18827 [Aphanomyces astaci]|eukprot:XP_009846255.1 hypothetical protein H257_18827 [Aphanomyces astaci]
MQTNQQQVIEFLQEHPEALDVRVERFHIANNLHMFGATSDLLDKLTTFDRVHRIQTPRGATGQGGWLEASTRGSSTNTKPSSPTIARRTAGLTRAQELGTRRLERPRQHTMGTMVGQGSIGVGPGATWIACRGCTVRKCPEGSGVDGMCSVDALSHGHDRNHPHFDPWQYAEIIPVAANGNNGPACASVTSPDDYKNVIAVGVVAIDDSLAVFSLEGRIKTDVSIPEYKIRSAWNESTMPYITVSGISMDTPWFAPFADTAPLTPDRKNGGGVPDITDLDDHQSVGGDPIRTNRTGDPLANSLPTDHLTSSKGKLQLHRMQWMLLHNAVLLLSPRWNPCCATYCAYKTILCGN